jgi:N-acetyl-1-D-myo-inositol-2-amino-2-deoxy-alpha-D-glucopyranoside deacetylase
VPAPAQLGAIREAELRAATAVLGVSRVELLGWIDSGMVGDVAPGSLVAAPVTAVATAIAALVEDARPDVVVTLDGRDGHRDHAAVRDATLAALARTAWRPARTYLWCLPRSLLAAFTGDASIGTPDEEVTTVIDTSAQLDLRWQAMRAHASQQCPFDAMDAGLQHAFLASDHFRRVDPPWPGGPLESDLLPGRA